MELILAKRKDLDEIKEMYTKIIKNMYNNDIKIWNEYYPNEVFEEDIEKEQLYLLKEEENILGAFVLCEHKNPEEDISWQDINEVAYLLNRVGVNVKHLHQGIGNRLVNEAYSLAKEKKAKYLRLLVSEINTPAINLYYKCGFKKVSGIHKEIINEEATLNEYGFELKLN